MLNYHIVRKINKLVEKTAAEVISDWSDNWVRDEHNITSSFFTKLEERLNNSIIRGINLKVKYYMPQGTRSEEKRTGADIGVVLSVKLPDFEVKKAFLAQAKKRPPAPQDRLAELTGNAAQDLRAHCQEMLKITPDSFVITYTREGFFAVPALSIVAIRRGISNKGFDHWLYKKKLGFFFEEFLKSFIGDTKIAEIVADVSRLEAFSREYNLKHSLYVRVSAE